LFPEILKGLTKFNLLSKDDKFNRVVFEKPFGEDLKSSDKLEKEIHEVVDEKHVFRIDHYLGKESVQNIVALKFGSKGFQHLMNNDHMKEIEIVVDEKLGVGNRIEYYDDFGATKDMIQNHLLQLLALLLMEKPKKMKSRYIHDEKVKILKKISFSDVEGSLFGQYKSYLKELGKKSKTETFSKVSLSCDSDRYKGVKIFLRTGKMLPRKYGRIVIKFKEPKNKIIINLQPDSDVEVRMHGKKIRNIDICPECIFRPNSPDAYEVLIKDIINNDRKLFVRRDEIHEAWRIVDSIVKKKGKIPFVVYEDNLLSFRKRKFLEKSKKTKKAQA
jgi:glucose-6-phosphate 1-dehydrogenase